MAIVELDVNQWAEQQFGACQLGDKRRTRRAVSAAAQFAADPSGSTTRQTESWSDCKAVYRLMDQQQVTFRALAEPHWKQTRDQTCGHFLRFIRDLRARTHTPGVPVPLLCCRTVVTPRTPRASAYR